MAECAETPDTEGGVHSPALPTLKELLNALDAVVDWHTLGIQLGLEHDELLRIEKDYPNNSARCKSEMLACCLRSSNPPNWKAVVDALCQMKDHRSAQKIWRKHLKSVKESGVDGEDMTKTLIPAIGPQAEFISKHEECQRLVQSTSGSFSSTGNQGDKAKPGCHLAEEMKAKCGSPINNGPPEIYKLPVQQAMRDARNYFAKYHIGKRDPTDQTPEKVLMVLGATGAGKSTLINGMANYILGVSWEDDFRFKLIADEPATQAHTQSCWITAYTFHKMEGSPVPYTLTIIHTPGFGDTQGSVKDEQITRQINEFFFLPDKDGGIDHLDAIGFVTQASLARLTPTLQHIFDSILAMFGKDMASSIFMMVTFADGSNPPVLDAIKKACIPFQKSFKFNNAALFTYGHAEDEDDDGDEDFAQMFWKMSLKSFKKFFDSLAKVEPKSLQLTKEVLEERHKLEATIQGLQTTVKSVLSQIDVLRQEERILVARQSEIAANKNFKYKVKVPKTRQISLQGSNTFVTNCLQCNFTCHYPCPYPNDGDKYLCCAMDGGGRSNAKCTVCRGHCHWAKHVNGPYRFEEYEEEEERTAYDLKKRYEEAIKGMTTAESMIQNMESHLQFMYDKVLEMIQTIKQSLSRLDEITLKPNPLTEVQYIELLIQSEKVQAKDGWKIRVQYYEEMKQQAMLLKAATMSEKMLNEPPDKNWWKKFKFW